MDKTYSMIEQLDKAGEKRDIQWLQALERIIQWRLDHILWLKDRINAWKYMRDNPKVSCIDWAWRDE